ncbi:hypothetical protein MKW98_031969 [Papaver atlanticum]|uniref:Uncharacterized protein n=1 Tax=Papaver atlanticum TaxID=357466 RepID=A0AAD4XCC6_9MAGN|nr:hypothetical protein MKW98_031969 [Papaver atlanticum]
MVFRISISSKIANSIIPKSQKERGEEEEAENNSEDAAASGSTEFWHASSWLTHEITTVQTKNLLKNI